MPGTTLVFQVLCAAQADSRPVAVRRATVSDRRYLALVFRPVGGLSCVVGRTGRPAPGLAFGCYTR